VAAGQRFHLLGMPCSDASSANKLVQDSVRMIVSGMLHGDIKLLAQMTGCAAAAVLQLFPAK
jgi:hypothetical protein